MYFQNINTKSTTLQNKMFRLLLLPILLTGVWEGGAFSRTAFSQDQSSGAVVNRLKKIRDVALAREKILKNVRVRAKIEPGSENFTLTLVGNKCRFDREVLTADGVRDTSYWLHDGNASFSFSIDSLMIDPAFADRKNIINSIGFSFWQMQMPDLGDGLLSVSDFCDTLINLIEDTATFSDPSKTSLELSDSGTDTKIEIKLFIGPNRQVGNQLTVILDSSKGYVMTGFREWQASDKGPAVSLMVGEVNSEYEEIASGIYFLKRGTFKLSRTGTRLEDRGQASVSETTIVVDSVEFGDIQLGDDYFDIHSWPPIKKGIKVDDSRVSPPRRFVYSEGPFSDVVLKSAIEDMRSRRATASRLIWYIILGNLLLFVFILIIFVRRNQIRDKAEKEVKK